MKKYLILGDGKSPHILKWIKELRKYYRIYLISFNGINEEIKGLISPKSIYILSNNISPTGRNYKLLSLIPKLKRTILDINPDIINPHFLNSYGFLTALTIPQKSFLIQSTWGSDILETPFANLLRYKIATFSLKKADLITSDSFIMSDNIEQYGIDKTKIITFPFGLSEEDINDLSDFSKKENIIFSNRGLYKNYNIDIIIKWFHIQSQNYKLIIANLGREEKKLKKMVVELGLSKRVEFVGYLDKEKQNNFYKLSKFYISIPSSDSTSVSLLEAMSAGTIPIVSNIPVNREWILDGINGIFFKSNLDLDKISIYTKYVDINLNLIKKKAIFSKNIEILIKKINSII